ncbi:NADP-dependent malic enzyme-like isoform X2 [Teleopsis dalmanni]|uniref:NADP-dependent malic enzyme-like isoform X2 n=1 Tax=Teleopsis dalmanni TaxID=139649 RepID=UPI0018CD2D4B|nr:NADP-dependent malic enzyme-like isoform X2 [Teleopsis dalmanni]
MGNSSSICSDRNAVSSINDNGSPVYPTAYNSSCNSANVQTTKNQNQNHHQHIYKTTIPVNEHETADSCMNGGTIAQHQRNNNDVINIKPNESCCCATSNNNTTGTNFKNIQTETTTVRSSQRNKNHTTTTKTATTIEYELSNGIAKLCKISTSRIAEEPTSDSVESKSSCVCNDTKLTPLLSSTDLENLNKNLNTINEFNQKLNSNVNKSINYQQRANYSMDCKEFSKLNGNDDERDCIGLHGTAGESDVPGKISGLEHLKNKKYNKGLAFCLEERQLLGIHGLLPAVVKTEEEQVTHSLILLNRLENNLDKYMYLSDLAERNERLFYKVLASDVSKMMPIVYTPTVGLACQNFSKIFTHPKGMYITLNDSGHIYDVLKNWPETDVRAIVVTDGERILGLGDLGANGMGIPVGKLSLYTALAGIKPSQCLPITLDVGTNNQSLRDDLLYVGLRRNRLSGVVYDEFIDEFMHAVVRRFGQNCLIQFEDFGNANAFRLLAKYRDNFCTFNDDIQGTASVALAGILSSLKIKDTALKENTILFFGAGEAALGIAGLCLMALIDNGLTEEEAKKRIWMVDSKGLIVVDRPKGGLTSHKLRFAQNHEPIDCLAEVVKAVKPTVLIGAAAVGGAFTQDILESMALYNDIPIIFALSNPTDKAECTAEEAYTHTKGTCIFASGSPFQPVEYNGKLLHPGQGNNSYIFPGVALGVICAGMLTIPEEIFLIAAEKLASLCTPSDLAKGSLYPPLHKITKCSVEIAISVMDYAYKNGLATVRPEPADKAKFIRAQMYNPNYQPTFPKTWLQKL